MPSHELLETRHCRLVIRPNRRVAPPDTVTTHRALRFREFLIRLANQQLAQLKEGVRSQLARGIAGDKPLEFGDRLIACRVRRSVAHRDQACVGLLSGRDGRRDGEQGEESEYLLHMLTGWRWRNGGSGRFGARNSARSSTPGATLGARRTCAGRFHHLEERGAR